MLAEAIEIHRSLRRVDCDRRAFVLTAVGIPNEVTALPWRGWSLWVAAAQVAEARLHLAQYQAEQRSLQALLQAPPPPPARPWAWLGSVVYALVLLAVAAAISSGWGRLDAFDAGALDAAQVQRGQWWRAWTALTLHLDAAHILANLGAGIWFGTLAGQLLGPGTAWMLIVLGAGGANLIEGLIASPTHRSAGASTAVFTALGLMAAYSWRERQPRPAAAPAPPGSSAAAPAAASSSSSAAATDPASVSIGKLKSLAPLVAGVILLGWLGTSGEHTDVMAHLLGFAVGAALGATAAHLPRLARAPQWLAGSLALGVLVIAWSCALLS